MRYGDFDSQARAGLGTPEATAARRGLMDELGDRKQQLAELEAQPVADGNEVARLQREIGDLRQAIKVSMTPQRLVEDF